MKKASEVTFKGGILSCKGKEITAQQIGEDCEILRQSSSGSMVARKGDYLVRINDNTFHVVPRLAFEAIMDIEHPDTSTIKMDFEGKGEDGKSKNGNEKAVVEDMANIHPSDHEHEYKIEALGPFHPDTTIHSWKDARRVKDGKLYRIHIGIDCAWPFKIGETIYSDAHLDQAPIDESTSLSEPTEIVNQQ